MNHRPLRRRATLLLALTAVLTAAGCATYQAPALPAGESAVIAIDERSAKIAISAVDGVGMSSLGGLGLNRERELKIAPGRRAVTVNYLDIDAGGRREGNILMTFDAVAGQRYVVHERSEGRQFVTWITDASGATVPLVKPAK